MSWRRLGRKGPDALTMRVLAPRAPTVLRRRCGGSLTYFEPCMIVESLVSIGSGMLVWMGAWDAIEILLPPGPWARLVMILVGVVGLYATRTMYDKKLLSDVRSRKPDRQSAAMLKSIAVEMTTAASSSSNNKVNPTRSSVSSSSSNGGAEAPQKVPHANNGSNGSSSSSTRDVTSSSSSNTAGAAAPMDDVPLDDIPLDDDNGGGTTAKPSSRRRFFDAPKPSARRCARGSFAIIIGLCVWVGMWDLVDYTLLPMWTTVSAENGTDICTEANNDPGPHQLFHAIPCLSVKLLILLVGLLGLWSTRSLYGSEQVHAAMFSRLR